MDERYEKALERAKSAIKECGDNKGRISMIESMFPELAESEDENTRNTIIDFVNEYGDKFFSTLAKGNAIVWLEKQGSITKLSEEEKYELEDAFEAGCDAAINKACEWLKENSGYYVEHWDGDTWINSELYEDFRKAMKEYGSCCIIH